MRVCAVAALVAVLVTSGTGGPDARAQEKPAGRPKVMAKVEKDLGDRTIAILAGATKVEPFRLGKRPTTDPAVKTIGADTLKFPVTATGKEQGKEFAAKVRAFLFSEATRTLSGASGFRGDVAFRLSQGGETVTAVVDFEGSSFLLVTRDAAGKQVHTAGGGFLFDALGGFDRGELFGQVKGLATEAFPDDAELRALKRVEVAPLGRPKRGK
jgi:hypothetical protein